MKKVRKILAIVIVLIGIGTLFGGCSKRYTNEDRIKCAQRKLSNKYGEEFQITEVFYIDGRVFNVYAYSVNHPDVIFEASYNLSEIVEYTEYEFDHYIEELVANQYKKLTEGQLVNLGYDYYLKCMIGRQRREIPLTDTTITIEEYNALTEENFKRALINIYISNSILNESNEYIYIMLKDIVNNTEYCGAGVFIITDEDLLMIKTEYETHANLSALTVEHIEKTYSWGNEWENGRHGYITFKSLELGEITYEDFEKEMEVIRNDAGY